MTQLCTKLHRADRPYRPKVASKTMAMASKFMLPVPCTFATKPLKSSVVA